MSHPVIKAGLDVGAAGPIVSYWLGFLHGEMAFIATVASLVYYGLSIYYLTKKK